MIFNINKLEKFNDIIFIQRLDIAQNKVNQIIKKKGFGGIKPYPELQQAINERQQVFHDIYNIKHLEKPIGTKVIYKGKKMVLMRVDFDTSQSMDMVNRGINTGRSYLETLVLKDDNGDSFFLRFNELDKLTINNG